VGEIYELGNGFFQFGAKKVFCKVMNGNLVVRVGGGYMLIDDFIKNYKD